MKISIIIPNWNGAEKLRKHMPDVLAAAKFSEIDEVIVSDDASTDNSVEILENEFPEVRVVVRGKNGGFASNVNFGVKHATGDLIVLLNTDASPHKDFLKFVLPHFKESQVFSVGCNVGGVWAVAKFEKGFFWHNQANISPADAKDPHLTLWASGGSSILRKSIWDELQGFDSLFDPFYEEDLDLGYRATKRGYINIWEPRSKVTHYQEKGVIAKNFSSNKILRVAERNQLIFIWKNITSDKMIKAHILSLAKMLLIHPKYWLIFLSALVKLPRILKKREKEKYTKLTDEQVLAKFV